MAPHRRLPAHAQYAYASHQSTNATGWFGVPAAGQPELGTNDALNTHSAGCAVVGGELARNAAYAALVTSVASMQYAGPAFGAVTRTMPSGQAEQAPLLQLPD